MADQERRTATRRPARPRTSWVVAFAVAILVAACGGDTAGDDGSTEPTGEGRAGYSRTPAPQVGDLLFLDYADEPAGVEYRPVAQPGNLLLVYFGYLSCPDVCPLTLSDISRALSEMPPELADRVATAMVSVDPERDTGEEIAAYLDVFTERNHALLALDDGALDAAGERFSAVWRIPEHEPGETYWVDHSAVLYVVDDTGAVVWEFPYRTQAGPLAAALIELFDEAAE